ncbi:MAG: DNA topoisomerase [Nibricoccus sp.]
MTKILIITEKPSVRRDVARVLLGLEQANENPTRGRLKDGTELTITNARGHVFAQAKPEHYDPKYGAWLVADLPITPKADWTFELVVANERVTSDARILRAEIANHSGQEIVNACDPEREGELIFQEILKVCPHAPETKVTRMWWRSFTDDSLRAAFSNRESESSPKYTQLAEAAFTRSDADWVYGMNYTVLASKTLPRGQGIWKLWSMGRVQTPTLALVADRCQKVADFKPQPFWEVSAVFDGIEAKAELDAYSKSEDRVALLGAPAEVEERQKKVFWSKEKAGAFITAAKTPNTYKVGDSVAVKTTKPPLPYDLQEIQKFFSKKYGLTATDALQVMQDLYERKLLTYPRTDCRHLSEDSKEEVYNNVSRALAHLKQLRPNLHLSTQEMMPREIAYKSRAFDSSKISDHSGIVPTETTEGLDALTGNHLIGYLAVLQMTLMALDEPATFNVFTKRWEQVGGLGAYAPAIFRAGSEEARTAGFTRWQRKAEEAERKALPKAGAANVSFEKIGMTEGKTSAPKLYTDATLLDAMKYAGESIDESGDPATIEKMIELMKDKGLGTPATRANIIDTLVKRNYLERAKAGIVITPNGRLLVQEIRKRAPVMISAKTTGEWEMVLDQMRRGQSPVNRCQFLDKLLQEFLLAKELFLKGSNRSAATGRKVNITEGTAMEGVLCPKSEKPILDRGDCFEAPGFPGVLLWKTAFGRLWEVSEYVELLKAVVAKKPYRADNLVRLDKSTYSADLTIDLESKRIEFHKPEPVKVKDSKCPKTKKPLMDCGNFFEAPGWPGLKLYKSAFGKTFAAVDWIAVLEGWADGQAIIVNGLVSKKTGNTYSARLVFDAANNKVGIEFN